MIRFLKTLALMTTLLMTQVGTAQESAWSQLLTVIQTQGEYVPTDFGDYRILSDVQPNDRAQERLASYISGVGSQDTENSFYIHHVEVVWEDWKFRSGGGFVVDQWLLAATVEGQLYRTMRSRLQFGADGRYLGSESVPTTEADYQGKWAAILASWYLRYGLQEPVTQPASLSCALDCHSD
ncbi:MAG: hypothetical protein ACK5Y2_13480 [Bdellovibrionales bacterium]